MKRVIAFTLILVIAMSLTACAALQSYEYTVSTPIYGEITLRVDPHSKTIICGKDKYFYDKTGSRIVITYPNGCEYTQSLETGDNWCSGQMDTQRYLHGAVLVSALSEEAMAAKDNDVVIVSALFGLLGLWHLILPRRTIFMLAYGWGHWKEEATPRTLRGIRIVGALMILLAAFGIVIA